MSLCEQCFHAPLNLLIFSSIEVAAVLDFTEGNKYTQDRMFYIVPSKYYSAVSDGYSL